MTMNELARFAAEEQMIPDAPVQAASSIRIAAPNDKVWSILTAVPAWESWYPYLKNPRLRGPFSVDASLTYGGIIKHKLRIAKVVFGEMVMLYGTMAGYKGITRWSVRHVSETQTEVSFTESSSGFLICTLYSNQKLSKHLQHWLNALKAQAEHAE